MCDRSLNVVILNNLISPFKKCGDKQNRTADLLNAIQALSQLSYIPKGI